jgi:prepilin-type N-terminal cleavage/methylation domain-containing protein
MVPFISTFGQFMQINPLRSANKAARRNAFTIVELLVVIAIIAILVSMLLPALSIARETARDARCKANMRQMAVAATVYRSDFGFYLARYISQTDSPLLESGGGGYLPARFGSTSISMLRNAGIINVKSAAQYSSGILLAAQRQSAITLCPSGQYFGPVNAPGSMGYVVTSRSIDGLDPETRIQDGYEFHLSASDVSSYQISARFNTSVIVSKYVNAITVPVKKIDESIPPSAMLFSAEYYYRDGGNHGYAPSMADTRGTSGYATEPWPKYIYYRTPHGTLNSANFSALDGHVAIVKLSQIQAAANATGATTALALIAAAKELPFTF